MEQKDFYKKFEAWKEASKAYYNSGDTTMSDEQFDELTKELSQCSIKEITDIVIKSITQSDGSFVTDHTNHESISLKKIKYNPDKASLSTNEIVNFFRSQQEFRNLNTNDIWVSPKLDGISIKIKSASNNDSFSIQTRGGQDVTDKLMQVPGVNEVIKKYFINGDYKLITGELVIKKSIFEKYYSDEYKNARNFVAGLINRKDIAEELKHCTFIPYTNGLNPINSDFWFSVKNVSNFLNTYRFYKSPGYEYLCDGLVLGVCEPTNKRRVKDNYPLNMVAVKFPADVVQTTVIGIEWNQKKSGNLIPTVLIEPTELDGCIATKVAGYNHEWLLENGLGIGSLIEIQKKGEIIPGIVSILTKSDVMQYPDCGYEIVGKHLVVCEADSNVKQFKFIKGLELFNLQGVGPALGEEIGLVKGIEFDVINLFNPANKPNLFSELTTNTFNKIKPIFDIKMIYLDTLVEVMQFDGVGKVNSRKIAQLLTRQINDISGMSEAALSCLKGTRLEKLNTAIKQLASYGVKVQAPLKDVDENTLTYELTGNPPNNMTKQQFIQIMSQKFPGSQHTSLTKSTKLLITNDVSGNSGKMNKARKYNIEIKSYMDILNYKN